jgi:hypothetical protein
MLLNLFASFKIEILYSIISLNKFIFSSLSSENISSFNFQNKNSFILLVLGIFSSL